MAGSRILSPQYKDASLGGVLGVAVKTLVKKHLLSACLGSISNSNSCLQILANTDAWWTIDSCGSWVPAIMWLALIEFLAPAFCPIQKDTRVLCLCSLPLPWKSLKKKKESFLCQVPDFETEGGLSNCEIQARARHPLG